MPPFNTDPFLSDYKCIERLVLDYVTHGHIIVAYDYDNTVYDYHSKGYTFEAVANLIREAVGYAKFIVYSCSNNARHESMKTYLKENDLPFDTINEPIVLPNGTNEGKIFFSILLDDRAGLRSSFIILDKALEIIKKGPKTKEEAMEMLKSRFGEDMFK